MFEKLDRTPDRKYATAADYLAAIDDGSEDDRATCWLNTDGTVEVWDRA